jgi:hypothetical protein
LGFDPVELRDLRDLVEERASGLTNDRAERERNIRLLIGKCDERIVRVTDALIDGHIDKETFDLRNAAVLAEKRGHRDQLESIASAPTLGDRIREKVELANMAYLNYENGNPTERRDLLLSITSNFMGTGKSPVITLKSPFREYRDWRISQHCDPCKDEPRTRAKEILAIFEAAETLSTTPVTSKRENADSSNASTGGHQKSVREDEGLSV